ncbi:SDR family oxidoreductase, partial [Staphylococcus sp. 231237_7MaSpsaltlick]
FAVRGMTKSAALELAEDNIRVNSVHPGGIKTKIKLFEGVADNTPLGRVADAGEVSYLVLYLLSDESSFTTGAEHVIDGGLTAE